MQRLFVSVGLLIVMGAAWGCSSRAGTAVVRIPPPEVTGNHSVDNGAGCQLIPAQAEQGEAISTVALIEPVNSANAPHPSNESERLLFRQLYETLVRVDCNGRAAPALAASWRLEPDGQTWVVALRENARFSDGSAVTSADVLSAWTSGADAAALRPPIRRLIRSAVAVDDRALAITLHTPRTDAPLALAHTDLAIAKRVPGGAWPIGTRPGRMDATPSEITLNSTRFRLAAGRDARDLLDEGVDLVVTRDPRVLDYAATLPQFLRVPLEWRRTHVFLSPGRGPASPPLSTEARVALANDAVRGEARGAAGPFWWESSGCEIQHSRTRPSSPSNGRFVYNQSDDVARDLAERLVGLSSAAGPAATSILDALLPNGSRRGVQRAAGLTGAPLATTRERGDDAGYIMELDRRPLEPCRDLQIVLETFRWLDPAAIVPLVDTRLQAIVRRGRSGLIAEWDGILMLMDSGR